MRLIIFDWDGTLMDSAAHIVASVQQAARQTGLVEVDSEKIRNVIGLGLKEALSRVFPGITKSETSGFIDAYRQLFVTGQPMATALFHRDFSSRLPVLLCSCNPTVLVLLMNAKQS